MKIIFAIVLDNRPDRDGAGIDRASAAAGHAETAAHRWMRQHHPQVPFETKRISAGDTAAAQHQIQAGSAQEQAQAERILAQLEAHLDAEVGDATQSAQSSQRV
jgi:hypothetical protein